VSAVAAAVQQQVEAPKLVVVPARGRAEPRLAPPLPQRTKITELRKAAKLADITFMPWQDIAGRYITAVRGRRWLYPEVAIVVARQNGKSTLLVPRIVMGLLAGRRITHTAQNRELPREVFGEVASVMEEHFRPLLKRPPRFANGQESLHMLDGGAYRIVAPTRRGARGWSNDDVIVDETRELDDFDFIAAAKPTLATSASPQMMYLSNAGDETSVVLNALRQRADSDPDLAYLEWSAEPGRPTEDRMGWAEANPALGHRITYDFLATAYRQLPTAVYETEHLCRWVATMASKVVSDVAWDRARRALGQVKRPAMAIKVDPNGRRASAVIAWVDGGPGAVRLIADVEGEPIDLDAFGKELVKVAGKLGVRAVGFDPWTDKDLARHFPNAKGIAGQDYTAASERFARAVEGGQLRHNDAGALTADLAFTVRREMGRVWFAAQANTDRPTTASLAAIRAFWLATAPNERGPQLW
jgi:phage terminase large subunit-like protein